MRFLGVSNPQQNQKYICTTVGLRTTHLKFPLRTKRTQTIPKPSRNAHNFVPVFWFIFVLFVCVFYPVLAKYLRIYIYIFNWVMSLEIHRSRAMIMGDVIFIHFYLFILLIFLFCWPVLGSIYLSIYPSIHPSVYAILKKHLWLYIFTKIFYSMASVKFMDKWMEKIVFQWIFPFTQERFKLNMLWMLFYVVFET